MTAPNQYSFNLGLGQLPDTVSKEYNEFVRVYNAIHNLASVLDLYSGRATYSDEEIQELDPEDSLFVGYQNKIYVKYHEDISAGQPIRLDRVSGDLVARLAIADIQLRVADGFMAETKVAGEYGLAILGSGLNPFIGGLNPGVRYYLSQSSAGFITDTRPGSGIIQPLGRALTATLLWFNCNYT